MHRAIALTTVTVPATADTPALCFDRPEVSPDSMFSNLTSYLDTKAAEARFRPEERALLLATPGIGAGVIKRLEETGIHSFAQIHEMGVQGAVRHVCEHMGTTAWANRRRALSKALAAVGIPGDC
jgi:predicted flap endonuclease-1-like 5' DNA nuclease